MAPPPKPSPHFVHLADADANSLLAACGGYVDAVGYLGLFGLFTSSITGNVVVAAASLSTTTRGTGTRIVVTLAFVSAAVAGAVYTLCARRRGGVSQRAVARTLLAVEAGFLLLLWVLGAALGGSVSSVDASAAMQLGALAAVAMGLQNSATREVLTGHPPTTVITSTLTNCGGLSAATVLLALASRGAVELPLAPPGGSGKAPATLKEQTDESVAALVKVLKPLSCFILGAVLGSFCYAIAGWHAVALPFLLVLALCGELTLPLRPVAAAAPAGGAAAAAADTAGAPKAAGAEEGLRMPLAAGGATVVNDATVTLQVDGGSLVPVTPLGRSASAGTSTSSSLAAAV